MNDINDNTITNPANDDDRTLLENGLIPQELSLDERKELLSDLKADNNGPDNNEPTVAQSADENDGNNPV